MHEPHRPGEGRDEQRVGEDIRVPAVDVEVDRQQASGDRGHPRSAQFHPETVDRPCARSRNRDLKQDDTQQAAAHRLAGRDHRHIAQIRRLAIDERLSIEQPARAVEKQPRVTAEMHPSESPARRDSRPRRSPAMAETASKTAVSGTVPCTELHQTRPRRAVESVRYCFPQAGHVTAAGGVAPAASFTPHSQTQPVSRAGLPTTSA